MKPPGSGAFRVKPLEAILADAGRGGRGLKRELGAVQLTLLGLGAIIGAGIFATIGTAAAGDASRPGAGPALVVSFFLTAVACGFTALCYAEFAAMVPVSGSAYTYAYATLGELTAWIIGWDLIIEYAVGNVAVAISWANYARTLLSGFGFDIPEWLAMDYRTAARLVDGSGLTALERAPHLFGVPIVFNLLAVLIVAAITALLVWGIRESARFNATMVGLKLVVLAFFCLVGLRYLKPANFTPFAPNGWSGIGAGAAIVFFAFIGFDAVSTVAEETRDPQRTLPRGIIASLAVCTLIYVAVALVFCGLISYPDLRASLATEQAEPLTLALAHAAPNLGWAVAIVAFGSVCAHTAVLLVFQLGQPRIFYAMSRDGLLPELFSRVHPRFRTPHWATIVTGAFVAVFSAFASIDEMVDLTNIGTLFAFLLVSIGVIVMRRRDPDRPRPFRAPFGLAAPILGGLSCLALIVYLPPTSWLRFAAWLNVGFVVYAAHGAVRSRLTGRALAADGAAHDARTARLGLRLALAGAAMLFAAQAFDAASLALRAPGAGAPDALAAVLAAETWRRPSWFLIVPLLTDALALAPLVARRALAARRAGYAGPGTRRTALGAAAFGALALAYALFGMLGRP